MFILRPRNLSASLALIPLLLTACGGGDNEPGVVGLAVQYQPKAYQFSWQPVADAAYYELSEDPDGEAGPQPASTVGGQISDAQYTLSLADQLLTERINASYRVRACTASGCGAYSDALTPDVSQAIGYFKASNTDFSDTFGLAVALSADGSTLAVGAPAESNLVTGVNGDQTNNVGDFVGAVYVYTRTPSGWQQQAYVKPSNARQYDTPNGTAAMFQFGTSLALSAYGHTLAVGAPAEPSNARGVNGDQSDASTPGAGAVYVFKRANGAWAQQSYLKASNTEASAEYTGWVPLGHVLIRAARFGSKVALSADGRTLAVSATGESSNAGSINGDQHDRSVPGAGAVYLFSDEGGWRQTAYVKTGDSCNFGDALSLSGDGKTLAVGNGRESSVFEKCTQSETTFRPVHVFAAEGASWVHQVALFPRRGDAEGPGAYLSWGSSLALSLSHSGDTLAVGDPTDSTAGTGINQPMGEFGMPWGSAGAAFVFARSQGAWSQTAYIRPSVRSVFSYFGAALALSGDGTVMAIGAPFESNSGRGLQANPLDTADLSDTGYRAGAAYLYRLSGGTWGGERYIKASNASEGDQFGTALALSAEGHTLAVSAPRENSLEREDRGDQADNSVPFLGASGAVYLY